MKFISFAVTTIGSLVVICSLALLAFSIYSFSTLTMPMAHHDDGRVMMQNGKPMSDYTAFIANQDAVFTMLFVAIGGVVVGLVLILISKTALAVHNIASRR